ncbi:MAG: OprD family outer membrane porin, partial [Pseudomonas sp.]
MYYDADMREGASIPANRQRETAEGLKFDYLSGFTQGTVGFGIDAQALVGIHLDGGKGHHPTGNSNSFFPSDGNEAADEWSRLDGNVKARFSKTEAHLGGALAPNLPILIANDSRLLPQTFEGGTITSKEIDNVTFNFGQLEHASGRASSNSTGLSVAGATQDSNKFLYGGADWKVTKDLLLQYYYANLEDFYKQNFLGLVHVYPIAANQSFKTDIRYFDSSSDGKNGDPGFRFNNNNGFAKTPGEVDNKTWSAMFTYTLGGNAFLIGHQRVNDDGGFVFLNQGNLVDGNGNPEGAGGASFYSFTDATVGSFIRAGENTTFGQYSYDFASLGVPGLKASIAYLNGQDIKATNGVG